MQPFLTQRKISVSGTYVCAWSEGAGRGRFSTSYFLYPSVFLLPLNIVQYFYSFTVSNHSNLLGNPTFCSLFSLHFPRDITPSTF